MNTAAEPSIATESATGAPEQTPYALSQEKMFMDTITFLLLMFGIFYFLLIRPQQKRVKEHKAFIMELKKGDRVLTGGGIIGTVIKFEGEDIAVIEIAPTVRVRVSRGTISEKISTEISTADTANDN